MWHGFSVFLIGITDMRMKFHSTSLSICCSGNTSNNESISVVIKETMNKLFKLIDEPYILVPDGSHAIIFMSAFAKIIVSDARFLIHMFLYS